MHNPSEFFERVEPLPTAPGLLPKVLSVLADSQANVEEVVSLVAKEPVLAAKILKLCNSVYFARSAPTADISEAINRIGFQNIYRVVVAICGESALKIAPPASDLDVRALWKHSVIAGMASELVASDREQKSSSR